MANTTDNTCVLVAGGIGFVASHCILQLLRKGYSVKTTIRSLNKKSEVIDMLSTGGITRYTGQVAGTKAVEGSLFFNG
ncbi:MAG: hypothetical protein WC756_16820 [Taibaiella sp.]|jgi:dihydroflavonol-4-reductase